MKMKIFLNVKIFVLLGLLLIITFVSLFFYNGIFYKNNPKEVVKKYLLAEKWEDRLPYILNPEKIKPLMADYYKNYKGPTKFIEIKQPDQKIEEIGKWTTVQVIFDRGKNAFGADTEDSTWYSLKYTENGFLIDWACSVGYNPIKLITFITQLSTDPVKLRLYAKLDDYYNFEFSDKEHIFYSIRLREDNSNEFVHGYVKRKSPDGKMIFDILKDGKYHAMIVSLRHLRNSQDGAHVLIDKFIQNYWNEE